AKLKEEEAKFLEVEKENAELQIRIKEEEAHRLQKEVLSRTNQIVYKNEMLKNLTDTIKNDPNFNTFLLERMIKEEERLDKNFDDFVNVLNEIHPEFYNRLQEKTKQKLTSLDLKYCVYIFMKMPTKEMADLLHVELKTVRMNKYRLKQKLGLKKEDSLEEFIQNII
ncbi:helix-turn-helix transcriptional regulator, partial [Apibacter adventoris]